MTDRLVLLTGAAGRIGSGFRDWWHANARDAYGLRLAVHHPLDDPRFDDVHVVELGDPEALEAACRGAEAVIHLAANPEPAAAFCDELIDPNIAGTFQLFEAARRAGVRRVIYASSVHAIMARPADYQVHVDDAPRPDCLYGATKVFGEALCSVYAHRHGMSCLAVRIGGYVPDDELRKHRQDADPGALDISVSQRDLCQLLHLCVEAPPDLGYAILHGLSDNRFKRMELESTRRAVGYAPVDDFFMVSEQVAFLRQDPGAVRRHP